MIQNVVEKLGNAGTYGVISICLFFAVFIGALIYALTYRKSVCKTMSALPLEDGECPRSADFQSAVSQVFNLRGAAGAVRPEFPTCAASTASSRLEVGDTAGLETCATAARAKGVSHE